MAEPRTHYQISLTARQAVGVFVGLLLALGLAYFFGVMTGFSGRGAAAAPVPVDEAGAAAATGTTPAPQAAEPLPPIETAVPAAGAPHSSGSRTELAAGGAPATPVQLEPTVPSTLQPFDDGSSDEAPPLAAASPGTAPSAALPKAARAPGAPQRYWVQIASLTSREQAGALSARLAKHGFRSQLESAPGPKGRGTVYRVRVGPFHSEDEAGRAARTLAKQEKVKRPWVVPDGK